MKLVLPALVIIALVFGSCSKDKDKSEEYLIFGQSYGECQGVHCLDVFKVTGTKLYEDKDDKFLTGNYLWYDLSPAKYNLVADLTELMPPKLRTEADQTFGCPDCYDQGTLIIQFFDGENLHEFLIDTDKRSIPDYLHQFVDVVRERITLINN